MKSLAILAALSVLFGVSPVVSSANSERTAPPAPLPQTAASAAPSESAGVAPEKPAPPSDCPFPGKLCIPLTIEFEFDEAVIRPQYAADLARVGEYLKKYPSTKAVIEGHTDSLGDKGYNCMLSLKRAESVRSYLVEKFCIDPVRLQAKGYGDARPVATNDDPIGRRKNRRIDAIVDCVDRAVSAPAVK
jgi:OOP family OmpA-OmpF porin